MNPILLRIGPFEIHWYSFLILMAFVIGYFLTYREFKKEQMSLTFLENYFCYLVPIVILGARLYYVLFEWSYYVQNPGEILAIWHGGLAIHGGVFAGLLFTIFYTKKHHIDTLKLCDIAAPVLILGQAIGRWGNFFNGEAYGPATTLEALKSMHLPNFVIEGMKIGGTYYQPTFFYESMICFGGFLLILFVRSRKKSHVGEASAIYFIVYGIARFFIEGLRQDSLMLGTLKVAQLVSIGMVIAGLILFNYTIRRKRYYHRKEEVHE